MSHRPMHFVFSTFLNVFSARDLGVVINSGLTTSDHVTADNLHVKHWQRDIMLDFDWIVQKLLQHHITVTSLKGPKGPTLGHFPSQGAAAPCPSPKSATAKRCSSVFSHLLKNDNTKSWTSHFSTDCHHRSPQIVGLFRSKSSMTIIIYRRCWV